MSRREAYNLYSVFVGHLSPSVTKADLLELFEGCGDVQDLFLCDPTTASTYLYGFVRFREKESVYKAVKILHRWPLKGNKIVVDIAKDTGDKIKKEGEISVKVEKPLTFSTPSASLVKDHSTIQATSHIIQDVMHLGRLKESYASLSADAKHKTGVFTGCKSLNVTDIETFMEDVEQSNGRKSLGYEGEAGSNVTADTVYQALLNSDDLDPALGMKRATQFMSSLKVVMGNVASFLKDHELLSAEAGELFDLCTGEGKGEGKDSGASSHSSQDDRKVYRDSGFESELETRFRENLDKQQCSLYDNEVSSTYREELPQPISQNREQNMAQMSECSSFELDANQFDEGDPENNDQVQQETVLTAWKLEKSVEDEKMLKARSPVRMEESNSPDMICSQINDMKIVDRKGSDELDTVVTLPPTPQQSINEKGEEFKLSSNSTSPSYSASSEKLPRSNYYRPISPVSPDFAITSSVLHSSSPKPVTDSQDEIVALVSPKISTISEVVAVEEPPTTISFQSHSETFPCSLSAHQPKSPSAKCVPLYSSETLSPYIAAKQVTAHPPSQHQVLHKSTSDSNVRSLHNQQHTRSLSQKSNVPASESLRKLDLAELFGSCNGQKQEVYKEKMNLNHVFSLCNGKKMELSTEQHLSLPNKQDLPEKHIPTGVQQEELQKCLERLGKGRGFNLLKTLK